MKLGSTIDLGVTYQISEIIMQLLITEQNFFQQQQLLITKQIKSFPIRR